MTKSQSILSTAARSLAAWVRLTRGQSQTGKYDPFYHGCIAANHCILVVHLRREPRNVRMAIGRIIRQELNLNPAGGAR